MKKIYLYPFWLRFWHWFNALLFFVLILSGISLHFSDSGSLLVPFDYAIIAHNISGVLVSFIFLLYTILNIVTKNYKHYIPGLKGIFERIYKQAKFYLLGIFLNEPHPFPSSEKEKFNPMQQLAYFGVIFFGMPLIIISGWLLMFPELAPDEIFGMGGVWPMALLHTIVGFFLSLFMIGHIYLGTTGHTVFDLFKSMITGWHLAEEAHHAEQKEDVVTATPALGDLQQDYVEEVAEIHLAENAEIQSSEVVSESKIPEKKFFKGILYNVTSLTGAIISAFSFVAILVLFIFEFFSDTVNPYSAIVTFVLFPTILLFGLFLVFLGVVRENRKALAQKSTRLPVIDLNNPRHQIKLLVFSTISIFIILLFVNVSFKAYQYTDSNKFCGEVCHSVMEPEYITHQNSAHSKVECVNCHIGQGANWLVKSKFTGLYQIYSVTFQKYTKPLKTPIEMLRPSAETCEQCHGPAHFYNEKIKNFTYYLSDENNTETLLTMSLKVGGGNADIGLHDGIHWHMNIANEISYLAVDDQLLNIPLIKVRSRITGEESVYVRNDTTIYEADITKDKLRKFDCMDCHNRPSHIFKQPHKIINSLLANRRIDKTLPYIRREGILVLENIVQDRKTSYTEIKDYLKSFYESNFQEIALNKKNEIELAAIELNNIYQKNYFPKMNVNWKTHPDHAGHLHSPGCFRCHDGKHVNHAGKVISNDCNICHTITKQSAPNHENQYEDGFIKFFHPGGIDKLVKDRLCSDCHGAATNTKIVVKQ